MKKNGSKYKFTGKSDYAAAKSWANNWAKQNGYKSFRTGGYTGDWKSVGKEDGKLAILHQKELVLNKEDTKNMLDAVNTIRDIKNLNGAISNTIADSIMNLFTNSIHSITDKITPNNQKQGDTYTIENITAEFPNAQDVDEIREAIMSLPRLASQYVARNLK